MSGAGFRLDSSGADDADGAGDACASRGDDRASSGSGGCDAISSDACDGVDRANYDDGDDDDSRPSGRTIELPASSYSSSA